MGMDREDTLQAMCELLSEEKAKLEADAIIYRQSLQAISDYKMTQALCRDVQQLKMIAREGLKGMPR